LVVARPGLGASETEAVVDSDGVLANPRCSCSHFFKFRLKKGPCRHLLALRLMAQAELPASTGPVADEPAGRVQTVKLPEKVREELEAQATRLDCGVSALVAAAWELASAQVEAADSLAKLPKLGGGSLARLTIWLADATHSQMGAQALRLDADLSALVQVAWLLARKDVQAKPTLH
jgi:hypothetical protein